MTASMGSVTLNRTTALTRAGTLSRVMISCGGIVRVTVRWSTLCSLSRPGKINTSPEPCSPRSLPSRKTTPRSYSGMILKLDIRNPMTRMTSAIVVKVHSRSLMFCSCRHRRRPHLGITCPGHTCSAPRPRPQPPARPSGTASVRTSNGTRTGR